MVSKFGGSRPKPEKGGFPVIFWPSRWIPQAGTFVSVWGLCPAGYNRGRLDRISCFFYFSGFVLFHQEMMMLC